GRRRVEKEHDRRSNTEYRPPRPAQMLSERATDAPVIERTEHGQHTRRLSFPLRKLSGRLPTVQPLRQPSRLRQRRRLREYMAMMASRGTVPIVCRYLPG